MSEERPPWESIDEPISVTHSEPKAEFGPPKETPKSSSPSRSSPPADSATGFLGTGFDYEDMDGDPNPDAGNSLRFWMPKGSSRTIIFVTDGNAAPVLWEHSGAINGSFRNWVTCLEPLGVPCPFCQWANTHSGAWRRYKARYFTIIDCNEFTDKAGRKRKNELRLFVAKKDTSEIIKRKYLSRKDVGQSLRGAMFNVFRPATDKSASVGEDFEFTKMVDLTSYKPQETVKDFVMPDHNLNFAAMLRPDARKAKAMFDRLSGDKTVTTSAGSKPEGTDATILF